MATTDQGGLNWNLNVQDNFTGPLQQFTRLVTEARQAIATFRGAGNAFNQSVDQMRALADLTRAQTAATRQARSQQSQAEREEIQAQRELIAQVKERNRLEKERGAIIRAQRAEQAQAARASLALDAAVAKTKGEVAAATKKVGDESGKTAPKARTLANEFKGLRQALLGGGEAGNRLVFTLRNIIGVGAGLVFIQQIQQSFTGLVRAGIEFNQQVDDSTVGIAGLLSAVANVRDAQGGLVTGAAAFAATFDVAVEQVEKLRQATLRTTATFQQLSDTFQVAVAPGLKAGLNIDQIRELAISVSQAAGALGVPTNQLSEEIRALLTGTIQARTTRIATALGITPDDIRRAKNDVGGLAKFLDDRFRAFEIAGEKAANTFTGTFRRAQTAIALSSGEASRTLFNELRTSFEEVFDLFTTRTAFGEVLPDPRAVQALKTIFDGIADAVRSFRSNIQQIRFDAILEAGKFLGDIFRGLGQALSGFVIGAVNTFALLGRVFRQIFGPGSDFTRVAVILGEIVTLVGVLGAAFGGLRVVISLLVIPFAAIVKSAETLVAVLRTAALATPFFLMLGAIVAAGLGIKDLIKLEEDLERIRQRSTAEAQLSKAAILQGQLAEALKNRAELQKVVNDEEAKQGTGGAGIGLFGFGNQLQRHIVRLQQIDELIAKLKEQKKAQEAADKADPTAGGPPPELPEPDQSSFLQKGIDAAKDVLKAIQDTFNGADPLTPPPIKKPEIDPKDLPFSFVMTVTPKPELGPFEKALQKMGDLLEGELRLMQTAITEFSNFVADSIVDAFDPTNDTSFQERFARFLQSIAKQIIATLTQIAISKLLLSISTSAAGSAVDGGLVEGFAEGGPVGQPAPSLSHMGIKAPRPKGLHPTDTVPAWLAPGEFVHRASAVARYGADFMQALNKGLVNPAELRAFAGMSQRRTSEARRIRKIRGYADGGLVSQQLAANNAALAARAESPTQTAPTPAFIVGNDQAVDRFLHGGKTAFLNFAKDNAPALKAILGQ